MREDHRELIERITELIQITPQGVVRLDADNLQVIIRPRRKRGRPPRPAGQLTECEQDTLDTLTEEPIRLADLLRRMDACGRLHGKTTVRYALIRLIALGYIRKTIDARFCLPLASKKYTQLCLYASDD